MAPVRFLYLSDLWVWIRQWIALRIFFPLGNHPRRRWLRLLYHSLTGKYLWGLIQFWIDWHIKCLPSSYHWKVWISDKPKPIHYSRPQRLDDWISECMKETDDA